MLSHNVIAVHDIIQDDDGNQYFWSIRFTVDLFILFIYLSIKNRAMVSIQANRHFVVLKLGLFKINNGYKFRV